MLLIRSIAAVPVLAMVVAFCSPTAPADATIPAGTWRGEHVELEVTSAGAHVEFDCAHGTLDEPLALNSTGQFGVKGTYTQEAGGPVRADQPDEGRPARYAGRFRDATITM